MLLVISKRYLLELLIFTISIGVLLDMFIALHVVSGAIRLHSPESPYLVSRKPFWIQPNLQMVDLLWIELYIY